MRKANQVLSCTLLALGLTAASGALALPRGVYKCVENERVAYQAGPCPEGAVQTPARRAKQTQKQRKAVEALVQRAEQLNQRAAREKASEQPNSGKAPLPKLDVETYCKRIANASDGYSATAYNGCVRMQRNAHRSLAMSYTDTSEPTRRYCERIATANEGGSYSALKGCIEMQRNAEANTETF